MREPGPTAESATSGMHLGIREMRLAVLLWCLLPAFASPPAAQAPSPARDRHVVLVSLDGFPARALEDPRLPVPTLRRLIREGASARRLRPVNPTVTWPNHTTMVTGVHAAQHGVLYNGLLVRAPGKPPRIEPWRDKRDMVRVRTLYDLAYESGLSTAQVDWVAIQNPGTITWAFAERPQADGPIERELAERGVATREQIESFGVGSSSAWRDQIWTAAATHIVERHRPNLLLFHLLALDSAQHRTGPGTPEAYTTMAFQDGQLAHLIDAIARGGARERTTVLIVSDHGFRAATRSIRPNAVLRQLGLITGEADTLAAAAWTMTSGGTAMVYVTDPARRAEVLPKVREALAGLEGVERVIEPGDYAALGLPHPDQSDQAGDLLLAARDGYDFSAAHLGDPIVASDTPRGHHGVLADDPIMDALFVAWGAGIAPGVRLDSVRTLDVAPTMAEWLQLPLGPIEGRSIAAELGRPPSASR